MQWVASTLHTTSEHGVSSITTADAHTSAASSRLNWRPTVDLNGLANAVGSQYPSHYLRTRCIQHYYRWCAHLGCQQSTELTPHGRFKWTRSVSRERRNLFSARVPSHFKRGLPSWKRHRLNCSECGPIKKKRLIHCVVPVLDGRPVRNILLMCRYYITNMISLNYNSIQNNSRLLASLFAPRHYLFFSTRTFCMFEKCDKTRIKTHQRKF